MTATLRAHCLLILESGELEAKLTPPGDSLSDDMPGPTLDIRAPARAGGLQLQDGAGPLPRPGELTRPEARRECLARFAHHELMAVELFAWALLRWPEAPAELRRALVSVLAEEQDHCRLYLERLAAYGSTLTDHVLSDYFWQHVPAITASPHGMRAFLAAMGLTLEQANLDFTLRYRDAFRAGGDEPSARVCQRVHDEEVGHVAIAARWMNRLAPELDAIQGYQQAVPFPLGAARAKGRPFNANARRRAGLSDAFIEFVHKARSNQETGRSPSQP